MNKKKIVLIISGIILLVIIIMALGLFFSLRSFSVPAGQGIDHTSASQIALQHAGVSLQDASLLRTQAEMDDGRWEYEVKFFIGLQEYTYQIDASTGTILDAEVDFLFD